MNKEHWKSIQEELGCYRCMFADQKALGKGACCTYPFKLTVPDENGKCKKRREVNNNNESMDSISNSA